jgi:deazaflavin-dependent oxidoreductase (nitroreductase family)
VLRAPVRVYDWNLGWVLGRRFLLLTHVGRTSGRRYRTVLEVIGENRRSGECMVIAGLGRAGQWYRNLQAHEALEVAIARQRFQPIHRELDAHEAAAVVAGYEQRNRWLAPILHLVLSRLVGWRYDGSDAARRRLVTELPVIALRPATAAAEPGHCADAQRAGVKAAPRA